MLWVLWLTRAGTLATRLLIPTLSLLVAGSWLVIGHHPAPVPEVSESRSVARYKPLTEDVRQMKAEAQQKAVDVQIAAERSARSKRKVVSESLSPVVVGDHVAMWNWIALHESGGDWSQNSRCEGGLEFCGSWLQFGGGEFAQHAGDATPAQQMIVAERINWCGGAWGPGRRLFGDGC